MKMVINKKRWEFWNGTIIHRYYEKKNKKSDQIKKYD